MGYAHFGYGAHSMKLFGLLTLVGIVLFIVWAARELNKKELKKLVVSLLVVGLLGMAFSHFSFAKNGKFSKGDYLKNKTDITETHEGVGIQ